MSQLGEGVSVDVAQKWKDEDKCVFCGKKNHKNKKKDDITATKWPRKAISGVGGQHASYKKSLYPGNASPPSEYTSEGHHCVAYSSFVRTVDGEKRDYIAPLNYYLKKDHDYDPNNPNNTIDLPGRQGNKDSHPDIRFENFEKAVTVTPSKPMQIHIGGHKSDMMMASDTLVRNIYNQMKRPKKCAKDDDKWKKQLKEKIEKAENKAFDKTASVTYPFVCHPEPLNLAVNHVSSKYNLRKIKFPKLQGW